MSSQSYLTTKNALAFAAVVIVGAIIFVSPEDEAEAPPEIGARFDSENRPGARTGTAAPAQPPRVVPQVDGAGSEAQIFAEDDDLIDNTSGFDPTPDVPLGIEPRAETFSGEDSDENFY